MQLNLVFLDCPDPMGPASPTPPPTAWDQLDEAARIAALEMLATLIARMLAAVPTEETGNE